ncbi:MAG: exosortase/archaeosortase family protein [Verrucomicrobiota bacterium]|nr:exosortase/archaeosortase family protein [Limisphaera sp.]MDW8381152.1 exosortase/archaeosortase family protein [Verrucomicrobiota bacterium]
MHTEARLRGFQFGTTTTQVFAWAPFGLVLGWLWWRLIDALRLVWSLEPRYAYGWSVPVLCGYLAWLRWERWRTEQTSLSNTASARAVNFSGLSLVPKAESGGRKKIGWREGWTTLAGCCLAASYAAARLVQEANPWWSLAHWTLGGTVVGITLWLLRKAIAHATLLNNGGRPMPSWRTFVFPVAFILVAVPWPYTLTEPIIQRLTRWNTWITVELLGWMSLPAVAHGNVIEVATGRVGVDEACSGIRSMQGTLMLSLFFGELYALPWPGRWVLLFIGPALAIMANLGRTLGLTYAAARHGEWAVAAWHDPAGLTVLLTTCAAVWGLAIWLKRRLPKADPRGAPPIITHDLTTDVGNKPLPSVASKQWLGLNAAWLLWLATVDAGVLVWYDHIESKRRPGPDWELVWPHAEANLTELQLSRAARELLQCDEARLVRWQSADGRYLQITLLRWRPGRAAAYLAKSHNPLVCMPAAGFPIESVSDVRWMEKGTLRLPYRLYQFRSDQSTVHVLYSRWEEGSMEQSFAREEAGPWSRLSSVWTGRGIHGQRVLVAAIWGMTDDEEAERRLCEMELKPRLVVRP